MISESNITLQQLKERLPTIRDMHEFLENDGWYLPPFERKGARLKCWSEKYLWNLIEGKSFKIKRSEIKLPTTNTEKVTKLVLAMEIEKFCGSTKLNIPEELPPKEWLKNVLYTLNAENPVFSKLKKLEEKTSRAIPTE